MMSQLQGTRQRDDLTLVHYAPGSAGSGEKPIMHPEDFKAHLAWVAAKEIHENGLRKNFTQNMGCIRFVE